MCASCCFTLNHHLNQWTRLDTHLVSTHEHLQRANFGREALAHVLADFREPLGEVVGDLRAISVDVSVVKTRAGQVHDLRLGDDVEIQVLVHNASPGLG